MIVSLECIMLCEDVSVAISLEASNGGMFRGILRISRLK
jgi:hypothetical protein